MSEVSWSKLVLEFMSSSRPSPTEANAPALAEEQGDQLPAKTPAPPAWLVQRAEKAELAVDDVLEVEDVELQAEPFLRLGPAVREGWAKGLGFGMHL